MADNQITFDAGEVRAKLGRVTIDALRAVAGQVAATQLEQVQDAFRNGGQPSSKWTGLKSLGSFRDGGEPLQDTGSLRSSFFVEGIESNESEVTVTVASASPHAAAHQEGFVTAGPNYIPLTLKGRRLHAKGANPVEEGLIRGVDFIMAWGGVDVPARPMIDYTDPVNRDQIFRLVTDSLGKRN